MMSLKSGLRRLKYLYISWFKDKPNSLNRRVKIENRLITHFAKKTSPTPEQCMEYAIELGVPDEVRIQK